MSCREAAPLLSNPHNISVVFIEVSSSMVHGSSIMIYYCGGDASNLWLVDDKMSTPRQAVTRHDTWLY